MARPKGSKNKAKPSNVVRERIKELEAKEGTLPMPKHVLKLTDWLYIKADAHCWAVCEVTDKKQPDRPLLYYTTLQEALLGAVNYGIKPQIDYNKLLKKLDDIYSLISVRIPADVKPQDLFTDLVEVE